MLVRIAEKRSKTILHRGLTGEGSGYRTIDGTLNLKPYSTISCNVTVTHDENAVGLVETFNVKGKPKNGHRKNYFQGGPLRNFSKIL